MRALQKYKFSKNPEHKRRIAQSFGYRISIHDMPLMIALCQRAGIFDKQVEQLDYNYKPETKTILI